MKVYAGSDIRNVAIVGHAHSGKTELITAILKTAKSPAASSRESTGAVTMYDEEEIARNMTMSNAAAFAEWESIKVNMIDTPGFHMFLHEARAAMLPAGASTGAPAAKAMLNVGAPCGSTPITWMSPA